MERLPVAHASCDREGPEIHQILSPRHLIEHQQPAVAEFTVMCPDHANIVAIGLPGCVSI